MHKTQLQPNGNVWRLCLDCECSSFRSRATKQIVPETSNGVSNQQHAIPFNRLGHKLAANPDPWWHLSGINHWVLEQLDPKTHILWLWNDQPYSDQWKIGLAKPPQQNRIKTENKRVIATRKNKMLKPCKNVIWCTIIPKQSRKQNPWAGYIIKAVVCWKPLLIAQRWFCRLQELRSTKKNTSQYHESKLMSASMYRPKHYYDLGNVNPGNVCKNDLHRQRRRTNCIHSLQSIALRGLWNGGWIMIREQVIITRWISIKAGQGKHFQVKLPKTARSHRYRVWWRYLSRWNFNPLVMAVNNTHLQWKPFSKVQQSKEAIEHLVLFKRNKCWSAKLQSQWRSRTSLCRWICKGWKYSDGDFHKALSWRPLAFTHENKLLWRKEWLWMEKQFMTGNNRSRSNPKPIATTTSQMCMCGFRNRRTK